MGQVDVLVFIDRQPAETVLILLQDRRLPLEELHGLEQQIIKVEQPVGAQGGLIAAVEVDKVSIALHRGRQFRAVGQQQDILGGADGVQPLVHHFFTLVGQQPFEQRPPIFFATDGKGGANANRLARFAQNQRAKGMKGANRHTISQGVTQ